LGRSSTARAINNSGQIAGYSKIDNSVVDPSIQHAFLYKDGIMTDLGTLGGNKSHAYGLNDSGHIVGRSFLIGGADSAFLYNETEGMLNLNDLIAPSIGWNLTFAKDINNLGQIVGFGEFNGETHAYLLNPVPEPATCLLFLGALPLIRRINR